MKTQDMIKVWDLPLRIFHWSLVVGFFVAYVTEEELLKVHVWAGYLIIALLFFRTIWGFVGNSYAQFSHFICTPSQSIQYVKDLMAGHSKRYLGHNPAGALMIALLLTSLLIVTITGIAVYGADKAAGPLAAIGSSNEKFWEETHEFFADFTLFLVFVHIIGVGVESFIHKENLVKAMLHGFKKASDG